MDEGAMKLKYKKCKYKVKKWESEFKKKNGVNPSKADIKLAPSKIKEAYRIYYLLKTQALESKLLDVTLDEDTQDCFNLSSSFIDISFDGLDDISLNNGGNSMLNSILDDTTSTINLLQSKDNNEETGPNNILGELSEHDNKNSLVTDIIKCNDISTGQIVQSSSEMLNNQPSVINEVDNTNKESESLNDKNINSDKVWGSHLNMPIKKDNSKPVKTVKPLSYSFSEKLFQNFNAKLRNPRKVSSLKRKNKVTETKTTLVDHDLNKDSSIQDESTSNLIINESKNDESLQEKLKESNESNIKENSSTIDETVSAFDILNEKVKVVIKSTPINQSVNITCKAASQSNVSKSSIVLKSFDKGWLERTNNLNKLNIIKNNSDLVDSGFESAESSYVNGTNIKPFVTGDDNNSNENKFDIDESTKINKNIIIQSDNDDDDDDDIVYNSDSETGNKSQNYFNLSNVVKRTFDKIDESNDKNTFSTNKKQKVDDESVNMLKIESKSINQMKKPILCNNSSEEKITSNYKVVKNNNLKQKQNSEDIGKKEALLRKKLASGKANNNFVRINIQKKVYVRGKKTMNFSKYKKKQWKKKKDLLQADDSNGTIGIFRCYKCNDVGHYARNCNKGLDKLIPKEDVEGEEEESPFPSLEEAEEMAKEAAELLWKKKKSVKNDLECEDDEQNVDEFIPKPEILDPAEDKVSIVPPIFKLKEDGTIIDTPLIVHQALLEFGHSQFRPGQEVSVTRILSGVSTLVTLSTGSGKSLCYQLPSYIFKQQLKTPCITLVVSPLVSLMEDQVMCMSKAPITMGCLHMNQTPKQRQVVLEQLKKGTLSVLIVSPETVVSRESIPGSLANTLMNLPPITFACIDEVHCVSQWSHNFRPSYLMLCKVLKEKFGVKTFLGLTATATKSTIKDIVEHLSIPDGLDGVVSYQPLPPNLLLSISKDFYRDEALVKLLQSERFKAPASVIVYCTRREVCEKVAMYLRTCLQEEAMVYIGKKRGRLSTVAEPYHAGLTASKRKQIQNAFMSGQLRIVVATIAFGMGINKQDVRGIIHYNMPSSFESYVQEVGRSGRDGLEANCHVFLDSKGSDLNELRRHIFANSMDRHTIRKLLQRIFIHCKCKSNCIWHEVAFSIEDIVNALDVKEESISTLLCYLELHEKKWITNLPHAYVMCKIQSYKGAKHLRLMARKCPPLAVVVARELKKGIKPEKLNVLSFPIVELASSMRWDSGTVKYHLKQLEWSSNVDGVRCKSGLVVEFSELGFRVKAPGNMANEELDCALDSLYERVKNQENAALSQLRSIFQTLTDLSYDSVDECLNEIDLSRSDKLKNRIIEYFEKPMEVPLVMPLRQEKLDNEEQIISDIRHLVTSYKDCSFTGRSVARVFHGIGSPNFPAIVMSRNRFWRAHLDQDFILLCNLASRELLRMR